METGQKIELLGKLVGVEKVKKSKGLTGNNLFLTEPEVSDDYGQIAFISTEAQKETNLNVGDRVYFGKTRQELRIAGRDIIVMDVTNVMAKVTE